MYSILRDPLVRRLILGCVLAALFAGVVIRYYGVQPALMLEFLLMSFAFILLLIALALVFVFAGRKLLRRRDSSLSVDVDNSDKEVDQIKKSLTSPANEE